MRIYIIAEFFVECNYVVDGVYQKMRVKLDRYEEVWKEIRETMNLADRADPFVDDPLPDAREVPSSGVWYNQESGEEETETADALVGDGTDQV